MRFIKASNYMRQVQYIFSIFRWFFIKINDLHNLHNNINDSMVTFVCDNDFTDNLYKLTSPVGYEY